MSDTPPTTVSRETVAHAALVSVATDPAADPHARVHASSILLHHVEADFDGGVAATKTFAQHIAPYAIVAAASVAVGLLVGHFV